MMHLMATNICVLIVTAVMETNEDYRLQNYIVNNVTLEGEITLPPPPLIIKMFKLLEIG